MYLGTFSPKHDFLFYSSIDEYYHYLRSHPSLETLLSSLIHPSPLQPHLISHQTLPVLLSSMFPLHPQFLCLTLVLKPLLSLVYYNNHKIHVPSSNAVFTLQLELFFSNIGLDILLPCLKLSKVPNHLQNQVYIKFLIVP